MLVQRETIKLTSTFAFDSLSLKSYALGFSIAMTLALIIAVIFYPIVLDRSILFVVICAYSPAVMVGISMSYLRGIGKYGRDAILQIISKGAVTFFIILVVLSGFDNAYGVLLGQAIGGIIIFYILAYRSKIIPKFNIPMHLLKSALPLLLWALSVALYSKSDLFLLKFFDLSNLKVGAYGLACRLIETIQITLAPIYLILFRKFRIIYSSNPDNYEFVCKTLLFALVSGLLIALIGIISSPFLIPYIFGDQYFDTIGYIKILFLGFIFFIINLVFTQFFIAFNLENKLFTYSFIVAVFNVSLNIIYIPLHGPISSAWIYTITQLILFSLQILFFLNLMKRKNMRYDLIFILKNIFKKSDKP
jgi:O-antigen/teichoic acid export membrane protein